MSSGKKYARLCSSRLLGSCQSPGLQYTLPASVVRAAGSAELPLSGSTPKPLSSMACASAGIRMPPPRRNSPITLSNWLTERCQPSQPQLSSSLPEFQPGLKLSVSPVSQRAPGRMIECGADHTRGLKHLGLQICLISVDRYEVPDSVINGRINKRCLGEISCPC